MEANKAVNTTDCIIGNRLPAGCTALRSLVTRQNAEGMTAYNHPPVFHSRFATYNTQTLERILGFKFLVRTIGANARLGVVILKTMSVSQPA